MISFSLFSCKTLKEIPTEKTAAQIIQMGQNEAAAEAYKNAEFCYNTAIDRYGTNMNIFVEAKYELAHIYSKQKKYDMAEEAFNEIIDLYDKHSDILPPKFKKLSLLGLEKIPAPEER